jgi:dTDP-4-dehydrorhamnose reductase
MVYATFRGNSENYKLAIMLPSDQMIENVEVEKIETITRAIDYTNPNVIVNCIGIVKQRDEAKHAIPAIQVNALFPNQLAEICAARKIKLILISTDCVFSGSRGNYSESDLPDPVDLYGRTKLLGEVVGSETCLTIRTSIIGWELFHSNGLLEWFASQRGKTIKGYANAIFSGFSTEVLSILIGDLIQTRPDLFGLYHISSEPISKLDLLRNLKTVLGWEDLTILPDDRFHCDRSLVSTLFREKTGWKPPDWEVMIKGIAEEWTGYAKLRGILK